MPAPNLHRLALLAAGILWGTNCALALDRTDFPIRVFIDPTVHSSRGVAEALPEEAKRWVRQGFLDWARVLLFAPGGDAPQSFMVILHREAEERQTRLLQNAGPFAFVDERREADLVVEGLNRPRAQESEGDGMISRFSQAEGLRVGKIQIAFRGALGEYTDEFALRSVVMHEAGHALGLAHLSDRRCNLMAPREYTCTAQMPAECRAGVPQSRCLSIDTAQVRFVQQAIAAEAGAGPRSAMADIREYRDGIVRRIRTELVTSADLRSSGRIVLKLDPIGGVARASVEGSFGDADTDRKVIERIRTLAPFGPFPSSWKDSALQFSFAVAPRDPQ
jgi:hypothetical protein